MKFLIVTKKSDAVPPEMALPLFDASIAYFKRMKDSGKIEASWGFAGMPAGAAIANVSSSEELQDVLGEYPLQNFSTTEVYPLVDINYAFESTRKAVLAMMPPGAGR